MNNSFCIKLAGKVIKIEPLYDYIREYCQGYITDEKEQFTVTICEKDIEYERDKSTDEGLFTDEYLETLAVYRKIARKLLEYNILLFHGSVVAVDGNAYLFTAKSGTGKSTHTRLWREYLGEKAVMVNDDKPLLEITEDKVVAHGTPWNGKHRLGNNISVPLKAICKLTRGINNNIEKQNPIKIYDLLLQQTYRPDDREGLAKTLVLIDEMMKKTLFYRLECNMDIEAAKVCYGGIV